MANPKMASLQRQNLDCAVYWTYVLGHAGGKMNKQADALAASAEVTAPLNLYPADFRLLSLMKDHSEDLCTIEEDEPFKHATASHLTS